MRKMKLKMFFGFVLDCFILFVFMISEECPEWSPDGKQIAFYSEKDGGGIYVMDSDGANVKLIHKIPDSCCPSWGGNKIVFNSFKDGGTIFIMNSDGSDVKQIFKGGRMPSWLEQKFFSVESEGKWKTKWGKVKRNF